MCSKSAKWLILIMPCSKSAKWLVDLNNYLDIAYTFKISKINVGVLIIATQDHFSQYQRSKNSLKKRYMEITNSYFLGTMKKCPG